MCEKCDPARTRTPDPMTVTLNEDRLDALLVARGAMTLACAGRILGMPGNDVYRMRRGHIPLLPRAIRISQALDVDLRELYQLTPRGLIVPRTREALT